MVALVYFALQRAAEHVLDGSVPPVEPLRGPLDLMVILLVVGAFAAVTIIQSLLPGTATAPRWQALYVHLANGLYVNTLTNRLILRLWPNPPFRPAQRPDGQGALS